MKPDQEVIEARRRAAQDDETREMIAASRLRSSSLRGLGWFLVRDGEDGLGMWDHPRNCWRAIHSIARESDGEIWVHVSMSRYDGRTPAWRQQRDTWWAFEPRTEGVIVLVPEDRHISGADLTTVEVLHVWGRLTGPALLPDFSGGTGSI